MSKGNKVSKPAKVAPVLQAPVEAAVSAPASQFSYACPSCGNVAIKTSNKMIGVDVNCLSCGALVRLDDENRYTELNAQSDHGVGEDTPPTGNNVDVQ